MKNGILLMMLFLCGAIFAQSGGTIKGHIIDLQANGEPLLFATVHLKNSDTKTETNFNGNFELSGIIPGKYMLEVSFAGYEPLEVPVEIVENQITRVDRGMKAKAISLADIGEIVSVATELHVSSIDNKK